jgi:hypothetical protein
MANLKPSISDDRLSRYRPTGASSDRDLDTLVNYFWNMALAESLHCSLCSVEVALRNAIHNAVSQHFGTATWYDQRGLLDQHQFLEVNKAKDRIAANRRTVTPGRVVGQLPFGFWVTILSRNYHARLWRANNSATLRQAFPRVPASMRQRGTIQNRFNGIRELRNSVFHHEPIFDDERLATRHQEIYYAIHWINPELRKTTALFDRFPNVHSNGRSAIDAILRPHLGAS